MARMKIQGTPIPKMEDVQIIDGKYYYQGERVTSRRWIQRYNREHGLTRKYNKRQVTKVPESSAQSREALSHGKTPIQRLPFPRSRAFPGSILRGNLYLAPKKSKAERDGA